MFGLPNELYTMKRGVKYGCLCDGFDHSMEICPNLLRYDITIIPPLIINGHFNKTHGHIHSTGHDEEYIVLEGEATFLLQKGGDIVKDVYYVVAKKGDHVIIPGDYHHNTTNSGRTTLKLANWVADECKSDYSLEKKKKGMVYYFTPGGIIWNSNYKNVPKLRKA